MTYYYDDSKSSRVIIKVEDHLVTSFIENPDNADFRAYEEWLAEGNTPQPWPPAE